MVKSCCLTRLAMSDSYIFPQPRQIFPVDQRSKSEPQFFFWLLNATNLTFAARPTFDESVKSKYTSPIGQLSRCSTLMFWYIPKPSTFDALFIVSWFRKSFVKIQHIMTYRTSLELGNLPARTKLHRKRRGWHQVYATSFVQR